MLRTISHPDEHHDRQTEDYSATADREQPTPAEGTRGGTRGTASRTGAGAPRLLWRLPLALSIWLAIYAVLNLADLVTTNLGLHAGLHEGNPLMSGLLGRYGFSALIAYKLIVVLAVTVGVALLQRGHPRLALATIAICNLLVGAAVALNILQYLVV